MNLYKTAFSNSVSFCMIRVYASTMRKQSKKLLVLILYCFAFNVVAASNMSCCLSLPDQQEGSLNKNIAMPCHQQDQDTAPEKSSVNCCQAMPACNGAQILSFDSSIEITKLQQEKIQLPSTGAVVLYIQAPPLPPPKVVI